MTKCDKSNSIISHSLYGVSGAAAINSHISSQPPARGGTQTSPSARIVLRPNCEGERTGEEETRTNEAVRHGHTLEAGGQRSCMAHSDVERAPPFPWRERTRIIYIHTYGREGDPNYTRLPFHSSHSLAPVCECENEVSRTSIPSLLVDGCAPRTPQTQRRLFSGRAGHSRNFVRAASGWTWCATTKVRVSSNIALVIFSVGRGN